MTAQPHDHDGHEALPEHTAASILTALRRVDDGLADRFDAQWREALDAARDSHDLTQVQALVEAWWRRAAVELRGGPEHAEAAERGRRWVAGEDLPGVTWDQILVRRGA